MIQQPEDARLVALAAAGDAEAFGALFRLRQPDVYRFALHMTASPSIAEDVTQDVFIAVMRDAGRYDPERASVAAWLCGIARNYVRRRLERDRPFQTVGAFAGTNEDGDPEAFDAEALSVDHDVLGDLTKAESIEALHRAVITLPVRYREAVVLCDLQEFSYAQAAVVLGCAIGTVRSRLHRARNLLAAKLTAAGGSPAASGLSRTDVASGFSRTDADPGFSRTHLTTRRNTV